MGDECRDDTQCGDRLMSIIIGVESRMSDMLDTLMLGPRDRFQLQSCHIKVIHYVIYCICH